MVLCLNHKPKQILSLPSLVYTDYSAWVNSLALGLATLLLLASQAIINAAIRIKSASNNFCTWEATHKNINAYLKSPRQQHKQQSSRVSLVCVAHVCVCVCVWATESAENYISWNFNRALLTAVNNQICAHPVDYLVYLPHPNTHELTRTPKHTHTQTGACTHKLLYTLTQIGAICQNPKDF